uniref:Succinate-semialdehyde dehydrogenase, mitochondrial n=1 Tax=Daucus carota subsp. sativus TaxID=79200 RepID=A0A175YKS6_DAUCS
MAGAAGTVKKVSLELGGNAPCITFDDAELGVAVKGTLGTKFRNTGQRCICANTILVQEGIYDKFAKALSDAINIYILLSGVPPFWAGYIWRGFAWRSQPLI